MKNTAIRFEVQRAVDAERRRLRRAAKTSPPHLRRLMLRALKNDLHFERRYVDRVRPSSSRRPVAPSPPPTRPRERRTPPSAPARAGPDDPPPTAFGGAITRERVLMPVREDCGGRRDG